MLWVVLVLLVIIAGFAVPRFGKAVLSVIAVLVVLGATGITYLFISERRSRAEREVASTRISRTEIELVDLAFRNGYSSASYTLVGRVRNRSTRYTLQELRVRLTMTDCAASNDCEIVGQTEEAMHVIVPPGQARDLNEPVYFSGLGPARGKHQWRYEVVEIIGK